MVATTTTKQPNEGKKATAKLSEPTTMIKKVTQCACACKGALVRILIVSVVVTPALSTLLSYPTALCCYSGQSVEQRAESSVLGLISGD